MKTAVELLWSKIALKLSVEQVNEFLPEFEQAKATEKEQAELYAKFAVLNDRSGNPIIQFDEFINIDNF